MDEILFLGPPKQGGSYGLSDKRYIIDENTSFKFNPHINYTQNYHSLSYDADIMDVPTIGTFSILGIGLLFLSKIGKK